MSLARSNALGQLLFVRFAEHRWDSSCEKLLATCRPGGVVVSARTLRSPESVAELLRKIHDTIGIALFLASEIDKGRGSLQGLVGQFPSPRAAAEAGLHAVARLGRLTGEAMRLLGFNCVFAPVLDLSTPFTAKELQPFTFGSDPQVVARCGEAFVRGIRESKILACARHFPGFGAAETGKHSRWPVVNRTMAELWREELIPYRVLLPRLPMVMVSHGVYRAYDFDPCVPAMISANIVAGLLRLKLGYGGVAVGDNLDAYAAHAGLDVGEVAVRSLNAGCDLLVIREEGTLARILSALENGLASGRLAACRVKQALARIRRAKKGLAPPSGKVPPKEVEGLERQIEKLAAECRGTEQRIA